MPKVIPRASKIYKPEILTCPICGAGLKYWYTVSNKVIQFTSGKYIRIENRGYSCPICNDERVYFSQTANKLAFKGCTYSVKTLCLIDYYKRQHMGRDGICGILTEKGIEISDRNIDILYKKLKEYLDMPPKFDEEYQAMLNEFGEIRISIDLITIEELIYVPIYNGFTGGLIAVFTFQGLDDPSLIEALAPYLKESWNITYILTVRSQVSRFVSILKGITSKNTKFLAFSKF